MIALMSARVQAQVAQGGFGNNPGAQPTGIAGVTYTNLTQNANIIARNFFVSGGVDLQPANLPQAVGAQTVAAPAPVGALAASSQTKTLMDYRTKLTVERTRLAQAIETKRRERQSWAKENAQMVKIDGAIRQTDRQIVSLELLAGTASTPVRTAVPARLVRTQPILR